MEKQDKSDGQSMDIVADNIAKLKELFPEVITENKIDFTILRTLLGEEVEADDERYSFNWHGKVQARRLAQSPSTGTLRPCKEDSVDWDSTQNIFIEGDNLEALKLLQKSYHKQVKLIYIDPPYNTGNDFVYPDNFHDNIKNYLDLTGQVEGGKKISPNAESSGRYHTDWLNMMYPRLKLARNLLKEDGVIFVSIDDNEAHNLRQILNEIFGEDNFIANIIWNHTKQSKNDEKYFSRHHNQILVFRKSDKLESFRFDRTDDDNQNYSNSDNDPKGAWRAGDVRSPNLRATLKYTIITPCGKKILPPENGWRWSQATMQEKIDTGEIIFSPDESKIVRKIYLEEQGGRTPENLWLAEFAGTTRQANSEIKDLFEDTPFDTPKPTLLIQKIISLLPNNSPEIVMDFFAGSGTTGNAVMSHNFLNSAKNKFILVQLPEILDPTNKDQKVAADYCDFIKKSRTIAELTKERLRRTANKIKKENPDHQGDLGFKVFKLESSNLKPWDTDFDSLAQDLAEATEVVKAERSEEDVLFEILLKYGLDLTLPIATHILEGKTVYEVGAGALVVCLGSGITEAVAEAIGKLKERLEPEVMRVVFKDSGFANDAAKVNAVQVLKQFGIDDVKSI